jgi:hypothetical protein
MFDYLLKNIIIFAPMEDKVKHRSELTKAILSAGFSPQAFAKEILGVTYQGFRYRVTNGKLTLDQYHKIMAYTGRTFDDLWPNPYQKTKKIPLTLSNIKPPTVNLAPKEEKQEPIQVPAPSSFQLLDVYDDGLSPL